MAEPSSRRSKREFVQWEPKQYGEREIHDLRNAALGPKGYKERQKRKLEEMEALHQADQEHAASRMEDDEQQQGQQQDGEEQQPSSKRQKGEGGVKLIPVSGRTWKLPGQRAGEVMKPASSNKTWEKKMAASAARATFLEHKRAAQDAVKAKRKAVALQRKAASERKAANRAKSEVVQKITNNATLKKMMKNKKQKKALRKADVL